MERYLATHLTVPPNVEVYEYDRVDLELHGLDHSGPSFAIRVFIDEDDADASTPREHEGYAGAFYVFGHGPCLGDEGHCDVRSGPITPYDFRPPHPLTPQYQRLPVTETLRARAQGETFAVTLVAVVNRDGRFEAADVMSFERLSVVSYT